MMQTSQAMMLGKVDASTIRLSIHGDSCSVHHVLEQMAMAAVSWLWMPKLRKEMMFSWP